MNPVVLCCTTKTYPNIPLPKRFPLVKSYRFKAFLSVEQKEASSYYEL